MDLKSVCNKGHRYEVRKRVGRGVGSGLAKTSGRGHKGQGARSGYSRRAGFEGGQMPIYRRVPKRGFTNSRFRTDYTVINVGALEAFPDGATVDLQAILEAGLVSMETALLKVLGGGELTRRLTVRSQKFSQSARAKIERAGGQAIALDDQGRELPAEAEPEAKGSK
jgi:large subunit ribosomal protein L15